jgi:hypothetical protein
MTESECPKKEIKKSGAVTHWSPSNRNFTAGAATAEGVLLFLLAGGKSLAIAVVIVAVVDGTLCTPIEARKLGSKRDTVVALDKIFFGGGRTGAGDGVRGKLYVVMHRMKENI